MILFVAVGLLFVFWLMTLTRKPNNFPPGPPRLPFIGGLPYMLSSSGEPSFLHGLEENIEKYGSVFGFYFGQTPAVVIADSGLIKEAYKTEQLAGRPSMEPNQEMRPGWELMNKENHGRPPGVIFTNGQYWKELRRFMLRNLRDFGFGKSSMEELIHDEVTKLCQLLEKIGKEPLDLSGTFNVSIVNSLWAIIAGEKLDLEDPALIKIVDSLNYLVRNANPLSPLTAALPHPAMAKLPILSKLTGYDLLIDTFKPLVQLMQPYVEDHRRTIDPDHVRDFLDLMLLEQQKADPSSCFNGKLGSVMIINAMIDMFFAGNETTASSLLNLFLQLLHHPEVQEKVQLEIEQVIGKNRLPSLIDRENMPFTNAVLQESFRISSLSFVGLPRHALEPLQVGSFTIPKGATVMAALYHVHHDPKHYKDPDVFNPNRYIDESGKFVNDERVMPFGTGKRACLGQTLAEKQFFIFFAALVQQFEFLPAPGVALPSYVDIYPKGLLRKVPPYEVVLKKRFG